MSTVSVNKKVPVQNCSNFFLRCRLGLCFGYVVGGVCPLLWCVSRNFSSRFGLFQVGSAKKKFFRTGEVCAR